MTQCTGCHNGVADGETQCAACAAPPPPPAAKPATTDDDGVPSRPASDTISANAPFRDFNLAKEGGVIYQDLRTNEKPEPSLADFLSDLPDLTEPDEPPFESDELDARTSALRTGRLLVINCSDATLSRAAAAALVARLGLERERCRLLNFERPPSTIVPTIYGLMHRADGRGAETLVLADAAWSEPGRSFVESLFPKAGNTTTRDLVASLVRAKLTVICMTDPEGIEKQTAGSGLCWTLSHQHLLRREFPKSYLQFDETISRQRAAGGWSSDDAEFYRQVAALIEKKQLAAAIDRGGPLKLKQGDEHYPRTEQPLEMAVLYTATFYPNLSPREFSRVLTTLLGQRTVMVSSTAEEQAEESAFKPVALRGIRTLLVEEKKERTLVQLWRERSDAVLHECHLITARETKWGITFADVGRREVLRRHFEENYGLYVHTQFCSAFEEGLLFDASEQIARDMASIAMEMARNYPDEFGTEWLYDVVKTACAAARAANAEHDAEKQAWTYRRIADLLRPMLTDETLGKQVSGVLNRLIAGRDADSAFELVKKLRFAPGFDGFYWLRQLVSQAPEAVRERAYGHLSHEIRQPGRLYPLLRALKAEWSPPEPEPESYSAAQRTAFRLVLAYCIGSTKELDPRSYGCWPSRFPMFALGVATAEEDLGLLLDWLFHRGTLTIFAGEPPGNLYRLLAALVAEWTFILLAPAPRGSATGSPVPEEVFDVVVRRTVAATNAANVQGVQQAMVEFWEELKHFFAHAPAVLGVEHRGEFKWKRELVRKLVIRFREVQRELRPPASRRATA